VDDNINGSAAGIRLFTLNGIHYMKRKYFLLRKSKFRLNWSLLKFRLGWFYSKFIGMEKEGCLKW